MYFNLAAMCGFIAFSVFRFFLVLAEVMGRVEVPLLKRFLLKMKKRISARSPFPEEIARRTSLSDIDKVLLPLSRSCSVHAMRSAHLILFRCETPGALTCKLSNRVDCTSDIRIHRHSELVCVRSRQGEGGGTSGSHKTAVVHMMGHPSQGQMRLSLAVHQRFEV